MEKTVLENYEINRHTMALLSVAHPDYSTVAINPDGELYIRKTPFQIIKASLWCFRE